MAPKGLCTQAASHEFWVALALKGELFEVHIGAQWAEWTGSHRDYRRK